VERGRRRAAGGPGPAELAGRTQRGLRRVRARVPGGSAAARQERAGCGQEPRRHALERAHPRDAEPVLVRAEGQRRRSGGGEQAEGAPGAGRLRHAGQGVPVRGEQADGGRPAHRLGERRPPSLRPPRQRLLRRVRRHGVPRQQGTRSILLLVLISTSRSISALINRNEMARRFDLAGCRVREALAPRHQLLLRVLPPRVGRPGGRRGAPQRRRHGDPLAGDLPARARSQPAPQDPRPRVRTHPPHLHPRPLAANTYKYVR
jgi:hypothetical protein